MHTTVADADESTPQFNTRVINGVRNAEICTTFNSKMGIVFRFLNNFAAKFKCTSTTYVLIFIKYKNGTFVSFIRVSPTF